MSDLYSVYVVPDETTEGSSCYLAYHPELDGCMNHGSTIGEAIEGLNDARELYLNTLRELGQPIPAPAPSGRPTVAIWKNFPVAPAIIHIAASASLPTAELTAHG